MEQFKQARRLFDELLTQSPSSENVRQAASEFEKAIEVVNNDNFMYKKSWKNVKNILEFTSKKASDFASTVVADLKKEFDVTIDESIIKGAITNKIMLEISYKKDDWN